MLIGRRYLLALTPEQTSQAEMFGSACRAVWNTGLEQRREYRRRGAWINYFQQAVQLTEARKDDYSAWLRQVPLDILQQTLRDLEKACKRHGTWKVHWKSQRRTRPSFRFPNPQRISVRRLNRRWGEVRLAMLGWVRFRWSRPVGDAIRNATVSRDGGRWYVSFCVDDGVTEQEPNNLPPVGLDRGVVAAVVASNGHVFDRKFATAGEQRRLAKLQQRHSRSIRAHGRNRHSNRRDAIRAKLVRLNGRVRMRRCDFASQTAAQLSRSYGVIAVEDLNIANMTASAKGTAAVPGVNVRQKSALNRAILDKGWGILLAALQHKARYSGSQVVKINPAYTSQTCNACGHVARESRESQAVFRCVACGHRDNADVNAAKNILAAGLAVTGRGDPAVGRSTKRQPLRDTVHAEDRPSEIPSGRKPISRLASYTYSCGD